MTSSHEHITATNVAVVLNGASPRSRLPFAVPSVFDHVILVDGGILQARALAFRAPSHGAAWLGDGDSSGDAGLDAWNALASRWSHAIERIDFCTDKDFSDFGGALDFLRWRLGEIPLAIHVFAGLGGRRDHEVINILEAESFAIRSCHPTLFAFHPGVVVSNAPFTLECSPGQLFSLVAHTYPAKVRLQGARYQGELLLERASHGLSNRAQGPLSVTPLENAVTTVYLENTL